MSAIVSKGGLVARPCLVGCLLLASGGAAWAQKYPGQTIPDAPPARVAPARPAYTPPAATPSYAPRPYAAPYAPPSYVPPSYVPPGPSAGAERDPQARELAAQLPLDPATANLQSRLPTDVPGTIRQLGLRVPTGGRLDLRNGRASTGEVIDALQH